MSNAVIFECHEDAASCDCSWHENLAAAKATHRVAACDMGFEEIFEALDAFHRRPEPALREVIMRPILGGVLVKLIENGDTYEGRGRSTDEAMANALEALAEAT